MEQRAQPQPAGSLPAERLRDYLRQLAPGSRAHLMREYERALERGEDTTVASFVLGELRKMVRADDINDRSRTEDVARAVFACLEPFLTDDEVLRPGRIRRSSLEAVWLWLRTTEIAHAAIELEQCLSTGEASEEAVRKFQITAAGAIAAAAASGHDRSRTLARVGSPLVVEDLRLIAIGFANREALDAFHARLPKIIRTFAESQIASVKGHLALLPGLQKPDVLPMALWLLMQRLTFPWQVVRLAISIAGADEEARIAVSPFGIAVSMALDGLARLVDELRGDISRGQFGRSMHHLRTLHDGLRGLRTELDMRPDSRWGRQLSAICSDVSQALTSEIESVPGRVRRLLRQRSDRDIIAGATLDPSEIEETCALVDFVAACRTYASELAINEVTLRAHSDLQQYLEMTTETLVESLRTGDGRLRAFRQIQTETAIRFCEKIFGHEYASLMTRAADVALDGELKAQRAG